MQFSSLPHDALDFETWPWERIAPYYDDLKARDLRAENVDQWLSDWSRLGELIVESYARLHVATTVNTTDEEAETRFRAFVEKVLPRVEMAEQALKEKLLATGL